MHLPIHWLQMMIGIDQPKRHSAENPQLARHLLVIFLQVCRTWGRCWNIDFDNRTCNNQYFWFTVQSLLAHQNGRGISWMTLAVKGSIVKCASLNEVLLVLIVNCWAFCLVVLLWQIWSFGWKVVSANNNSDIFRVSYFLCPTWRTALQVCNSRPNLWWIIKAVPYSRTHQMHWTGVIDHLVGWISGTTWW